MKEVRGGSGQGHAEHIDHGKDFGFYSATAVKPLKDFDHKGGIVG